MLYINSYGRFRVVRTFHGGDPKRLAVLRREIEEDDVLWVIADSFDVLLSHGEQAKRGPDFRPDRRHERADYENGMMVMGSRIMARLYTLHYTFEASEFWYSSRKPWNDCTFS